MKKYAIGLDYGTNSCRALIVDLSNGAELASHVFNYPTGEAGVIVDPSDPNLARQNPADYVQGAEVTIVEAIKKAKADSSAFSAENIIGIGVDTTGSSPLAVDKDGVRFHTRIVLKRIRQPMSGYGKIIPASRKRWILQKKHLKHVSNTLIKLVVPIHRNGSGAKFGILLKIMMMCLKLLIVLLRYVTGSRLFWLEIPIHKN